MGLIFGLIKRLIKLSLYFIIFAAVIVLIPNLPPYTNFTSIKLEPTQPSVGPLAPNELLNNAESLYKGKLLGPEAFELYKGEVYTSLATGEIVKLSPGGHVTFVTKIGQPCAGSLDEHICGRPLGFKIDEKKNVMYVADAYYGIWKVDLKTDKKQLLVSPRVSIGDRPPKLFNSIALGPNGELYWTDSSSDFQLKDGVYTLFTDPSGRLFQYNEAKNESRILLDKIWFANGVAVSPDNQFVVVAETSGFRLLKSYINGPNKGKSEVFVAGLPGTPDNVRALPDGSGLLVGLYTVFDDDTPMLLKSMSETPPVRKFIARLMRLAEIPFEFLNKQYPHVLFEEIVYYIGHYKSLSGLTPPKAGLVQIDWNGNIVASYYNTDKTMPQISDAIVYNDKLYLGAPHVQDFVGAVPAPALLKKAFATKPSEAKEVPKVAPEQAKPVPKQTQEQPKVQERKEAPKPAPQEVPKPTAAPKPTEPPKTTTPKPVEKKPEAPTTQSPPKTTPPPPVETKPKPQAKPEQPKPAPPKQPADKPAPATDKPKTATPTVKPVKVDDAKGQKSEPQKPPKTATPKPSREQIPIKEEIPSDTAKPPKENLKVIKKGGPTEIPVPNL